jgi:hypothetical protein
MDLVGGGGFLTSCGWETARSHARQQTRCRREVGFFLPRLLFDANDGGNIFLRNVKLPSNYGAL